MGSLGRRRFSRTEIRGKQGFWLVDVAVGGHVYHWSTVDLDVESDDGTIHYDGVLTDVSYQVAMDLFQVANPHAVNIEALVAGMPDVLKSGRNIRGVAEASRWYTGMVWEDRVPKVRGFVSDPEIGEDFLRCAITAEVFEDTGSIPETTAKVDSSTWTRAYLGSGDVGLAYAIPLGRPGATDRNFFGYISGSQAVWASKRSTAPALIIAGCRVGATEVVLIHDDFWKGYRFKVYHTTDSRGRTVAWIDDSDTGDTADNLGPGVHDTLWHGLQSASLPALATAALGPIVTETSDVYVGWRDFSDSTLGGAVGPDGKLIQKAGDVLRFVMGYSSIKVDDGAFAAAAPHFAGFLIDGVIEAHCKPWEWVQSELLPLLPVSFVVGPWGVRPIVWRWEATSNDAVVTLDEDAGSAEFGDSIEIDCSNIRNRFSIEFGWSMRTQTYSYTARLDAEAEVSTGYATGRLVRQSANGETILLTSLTQGHEGRYRVTCATGGAATATYNAATRTVAVTFNAGVSTGDDIVSAINASAQVIQAEAEDGSEIWSVTDTADQTLILDDDGTAGSHLCRVSQERYRDLDTTGSGVFEEALKSAYIYDANTANRVLQWRASAFALEQRRVIVTGPASEYEWLDVGDVVLLTCARLSLSSALAHIEEVEIHDDGDVYLRCLMIDDPLRGDVL